MTSVDINEIRAVLPHRYPFLLVDRINELEPDRRVIGIKNVTVNEPFFQGHFPDRPIMPGVLILEAMAQVGGVLAMKSNPPGGAPVVYLTGVDQAKFRKPVVPGDLLIFEVELGRLRARTGQVKGRALVDGKLDCEAELMFALGE